MEDELIVEVSNSKVLKSVLEVDIISNCKLMQLKYPIPSLAGNSITLSMRSILTDWLVEVADEYNVSGHTLVLAIKYTFLIIF